jgi:hypothetical protein
MSIFRRTGWLSYIETESLSGIERLEVSSGSSQPLLQLRQIYFVRVVDDLICFVQATPFDRDRFNARQPIQGLLADVVSGDCELRPLQSGGWLVAA